MIWRLRRWRMRLLLGCIRQIALEADELDLLMPGSLAYQVTLLRIRWWTFLAWCVA